MKWGALGVGCALTIYTAIAHLLFLLVWIFGSMIGESIHGFGWTLVVWIFLPGGGLAYSWFHSAGGAIATWQWAVIVALAALDIVCEGLRIIEPILSHKADS